MVQFDDLSAWITVDGRALDEYSQEFNDELGEVTCWVPSQEGKEFQLQFLDKCIHHDVGVYFYVDGNEVSARILANTAEPRNRIFCAGIKSSPETERPFIFSKTQLIEADAIPQTPSAALGEIKVECWSVDIGDEVPFGQPEFSAVDSVSEREKVDATHHVGLGDARRAEARLSREATRCSLLASFLFRYRPIEILWARGLAPVVPLDSDAIHRDISEPADVPPPDPRLDDLKDTSESERPASVDVARPDVKKEEDSKDDLLDDPKLIPQKRARSASPISSNADPEYIDISEDERDDEERMAALRAELARIDKRQRVSNSLKAQPIEKKEDLDLKIRLF
ncbi:hypothetical protein CYLTODRAFT_453068 [Cylindrobasidium torrendii FP15055 ss-10]|uniref:DUF7918 domain-containing protein n=1 Tax=Cylindrobasidium torrendii FP15055 ss-10 TaxID=1314674 RepID=A0A0D7BH02_9AGAR|nr:hypothetical protein CYLTODRAFT_453068 [Cylindrobasidium torrendii FP15055 ss-10]